MISEMYFQENSENKFSINSFSFQHNISDSDTISSN